MHIFHGGGSTRVLGMGAVVHVRLQVSGQRKGGKCRSAAKAFPHVPVRRVQVNIVECRTTGSQALGKPQTPKFFRSRATQEGVGKQGARHDPYNTAVNATSCKFRAKMDMRSGLLRVHLIERPKELSCRTLWKSVLLDSHAMCVS